MRENGVLDVAAAIYESKKADDLWANLGGKFSCRLNFDCSPNLQDEGSSKADALYVSASV